MEISFKAKINPQRLTPQTLLLKAQQEKYFPKYYKNPYVGIFKNKQQPFIDRAAVRVLVWTKRLGMLGFIAKLITR